MRWRSLALILGSSLLGVVAGLSEVQAQRPSVDTFIQQFDADHDGTLSLEEIKKAAIQRFGTLDNKHKGRLSRNQLSGVLNFRQFRKADKNKDGTVDQDEFLTVTEELFQAADADHDGTLDKKELGTSSGRALLRLFAIRQGPMM